MTKQEMIDDLLQQLKDLYQERYEASFDPFYFIFNKDQEFVEPIWKIKDKLHALGVDTL